MIDLGSTATGGQTRREEDEEKIFKNVEELQSLSNINIYKMQMSKFLSGLTHTDVRKGTAVH